MKKYLELKEKYGKLNSLFGLKLYTFEKESFYEECKKLGVKPSKLIRSFINKFIENEEFKLKILEELGGK